MARTATIHHLLVGDASRILLQLHDPTHSSILVWKQFWEKAMCDFENAIWDDGEWVSWQDINRQIQYKEWGAKYPNADRGLIPIFESLLNVAAEYFEETGRHLHVYGDIGELYGAITYGIKLHSNYAQGSDGRLGNEFVEVKTITPFKNRDEIEVNMERHFSQILMVKINKDFEIAHKLIARSSLPKSRNKKLRIKWTNR